ncbi:MAG: DUF1566 domain-containing protein [Thiohalocapsa sp.]|jgi:hypothetical protein|uniref:hypothetical protein n=1 Tax=Thiohalocapsa sp. TaxID=2497641 RepID=UPI0025FDF27D|nr:hypothetical protein [Thiohalocapsa sp.]MCG6942374.1 DUF1566 domain-containing protein [Thiohalocapsa sp.]
MNNPRRTDARRLGAPIPDHRKVGEIPLLNYRASGIELVHDIDSGPDGITWTQDANLFKTQCRLDGTVVDQIIGLVPTVTDGQGVYFVAPEDFDAASGAMTWWGAMAWAKWLRLSRFAGGAAWRLCSAANCNGSAPRAGRGVMCSEIGRLHYAGRRTGTGTGTGSPISTNRYLARAFHHLHNDLYWTGTEYGMNADGAWLFCTSDGTQYFGPKQRKRLAWAVHEGPVGATRLAGTSPLDNLLCLKALDTAGQSHQARGIFQ